MSGAFDLLDRSLVFVPVKWPGVAQADDGSAVPAEHVVEIQVELLDRDEFADWIIDANKTIDDKAERIAHELAVFRRVAKGWRKIKANGRDVNFDDDNILKLLRWPGFVAGFGDTYMDTWRGEIAIREGNSEGSLASGQAVEPTAATKTDTTPRAN